MSGPDHHPALSPQTALYEAQGWPRCPQLRTLWKDHKAQPRSLPWKYYFLLFSVFSILCLS